MLEHAAVAVSTIRSGFPDQGPESGPFQRKGPDFAQKGPDLALKSPDSRQDGEKKTDKCLQLSCQAAGSCGGVPAGRGRGSMLNLSQFRSLHQGSSDGIGRADSLS